MYSRWWAFFYQAAVVGFKTEVVIDMYPQVFEARDNFHLCCPNAKRRGLVPGGLSEVHNHFLSFFYIDAKIAVPAPGHQLFHLESVSWLVILLNESHHKSIICKLDNMVTWMSGRVILCQQSVQQQTQDTSLLQAGVEISRGGNNVMDLYLFIYNSKCLRDI